MTLNSARNIVGEFDDIGFTFCNCKPEFTVLVIDSVTFKYQLEYPINDIQEGGVVIEFDTKTNKVVSFKCSNPN